MAHLTVARGGMYLALRRHIRRRLDQQILILRVTALRLWAAAGNETEADAELLVKYGVRDGKIFVLVEGSSHNGRNPRNYGSDPNSPRGVFDGKLIEIFRLRPIDFMKIHWMKRRQLRRFK